MLPTPVRELRLRATTILQLNLRIRAPFASTMGRRTRIKGTGMTEQQNVLAAEREEIATRVASFKATQEKFQREREEYFVATLQKAQRIRTPAILVLGTTLRSDPDTFIAQRGNPESRN